MLNFKVVLFPQILLSQLIQKDVVPKASPPDSKKYFSYYFAQSATRSTFRLSQKQLQIAVKREFSTTHSSTLINKEITLLNLK